MTVVATAAGIAVIVLVARDVFDTLFHPHGRGVVSEALVRASWKGLKVIGRRRTHLLSLAGPVAFLLVVVSWVALVVAGGMLIILPQLPESYATAAELGTDEVNGVLGATYVSFVNLTSLGFGDIVARTDALRLLGPVQAIIGLAILTASISWILSIYRVLGEFRALAREIGLLCDALETTGRSLPSLGVESAAAILADLTSRMIAVRGDYLDFPITYYFHGRDSRHDLAGALARMLPAIQRIRDAEQAPAVTVGAERLGLAIDELLATIDDEFLVDDGSDAASVLVRWQRDHLRQA